MSRSKARGGKGKVSKKKRHKILNRDGYVCQAFGCDRTIRLTIDHIIPWAKGGSNAYSNLITLCDKCNRNKGDEIVTKWFYKPTSMVHSLKTYSVFANHHLRVIDGLEKWITELVFYRGDFSHADLKHDWRFKAVEGKRDELKFLGTCSTEFPITYPLELANGHFIRQKDYFTSRHD